jgi:tetratricopeptide (TPR) repeat protein
MPPLQRGFVIASVFAILLSGLGYDPLALLIPGMAPNIFPALLIVALLYQHMNATARLSRQHRRELDNVIQEVQSEQNHTAGRLDSVDDATARLSAATRTLQQTLAEQETLIPAKVLLLQHRYDDVVQLLQDSLERSSANAEACWLLGEALVGNKRYAEALSHLQAGLVDDDIHRLTVLAQCEQALGQHADAEHHLLQLIELRGEKRQQDLVALGAVQSEIAPERATDTLSQALHLNPYNSAARYQLMELKMRTGAYDDAIRLAQEGLDRNASDIGCFVSRAEALYRRGHDEDEHDILQDLTLAQAKNRRDYNIYRLRGALHQRQANRADNPNERREALRLAIEAYEDGLTHVPAKFQAHLLAAESRVFLQLKRFTDAVKSAQCAVDHSSGHVSNHLALALARLAAGHWRSSAQAAEQGLPWAGWGGRIWLTAISIFAHACGGAAPETLQEQCVALCREIGSDSRRFELSDTWSVVREVLSETRSKATASGHALVRDTIALLEHAISPDDYRRTWGDMRNTHDMA